MKKKRNSISVASFLAVEQDVLSTFKWKQSENYGDPRVVLVLRLHVYLFRWYSVTNDGIAWHGMAIPAMACGIYVFDFCWKYMLSGSEQPRIGT